MISQITALFIALAALYQAHKTGSKLEAERGLLQAEAKKEGVDGAGTLAETALALIVPLKTRVQELEESDAKKSTEIRELKSVCVSQESRLKHVERENAELTLGVQILSDQIRDLGHAPRYTPPSRGDKGA